MGDSLIKPRQDTAQSAEAALHWMIALEDKPDDAEVATAFEAWLASSDDHVKAWAEARHVWKVLGAAHEAREMAGRRDHMRRSSSKTPMARGTRRRGYFTASILAVATICVAAVFLQDIRIWLQADYSTGVAQTREIRLEDGSTVHLGADSAIEVAFDQASRNIRLLTGEAYFEVEPDAARPFRVDAGDVDTTVLGTAFDVRMMAEGTAIAVNRGRVAVASSTAAEVSGAPLEAGDWVRVSHAGKVERGRDVPDLAGGWRSGMLVVKDRSVGEVAEALGRYYRGRIVLADAAIAGQRVTGVYNLNEPIGALTAVAAAHGAYVHQISPWLAVVSSW
ncbi:FecR family protein [Aminobacter sp. DSM 101952]|uniref:FecR family protein n=1 Tax=Aminobacter sp. DSM 101952 TaxID=2735891 RepID=UPI00138F4149|nr:FecR family protein [Aminobacter sp. DSM 101952]